MKNEIVVGIDPHSDSLGCVMMHEHNILSGFSIPNCSKEHTDRLIAQAEKFAKQFSAEIVFAIETTNVFWRPVFSYLKRQGYTVFTVNSLQTKNARGTKMRKTKTDIIDAKNIVAVYLQDNAHKTNFPEGVLFDLREITRLYSWLVNLQARFLDRIHVYLFQVFPEIYSVFKKGSVNSNTVLTLLKQELLHPENLRHTRVDKLANVIYSASHGKFDSTTAEKLKELAKSSFGIPEGKQGFSICLKTLASLYEHFDNLLKSLELEIIEPLLSQVQHPFSSLKGLGTVPTTSFVSELGNPHNFKKADGAVAFFGYDPSISQSGKRTGQGKHISKCGTKYGRETMYLAAGSCMLHNPVLLAKYKKLRKSRHWKDAKSILAADLIKICYAMYRDNSQFDSSKIY